MTTSPPVWLCRNARSQPIESASRWLVGSSSSSVVSDPEPVSDAANRMRRQLDAAALTAGQRAQRLGQDALGQAEARADAARLALGGVPAERGEPLLELAVAADRLVAGGVVGDLGHDRLLLLQIGEQRVETARREHPVAGQHVEVALSGILRQVADLTGPRRWCPRRARPRRRGCAWWWSCLRRCGRRGRCGRPAGSAARRPRWTAACARQRGPRGPLR